MVARPHGIYRIHEFHFDFLDTVSPEKALFGSLGEPNPAPIAPQLYIYLPMNCIYLPAIAANLWIAWPENLCTFWKRGWELSRPVLLSSLLIVSNQIWFSPLDKYLLFKEQCETTDYLNLRLYIEIQMSSTPSFSFHTTLSNQYSSYFQRTSHVSLSHQAGKIKG